ncbi:MAG TPA: hypothetical protein VMU93_14570 [Caulobacteraceae bacterium]|nr:hypothetical protein [Caulobacteraceae bacterium]
MIVLFAVAPVRALAALIFVAVGLTVAAQIAVRVDAARVPGAGGELTSGGPV